MNLLTPIDVEPSDDAATTGCRLRAAIKDGHMSRSRSGAWSVILSYDSVDKFWIFSARLVDGSQSKNEDWEHLGRLAAAVGVPSTEFGQADQSILHNPAGTHKWMWTDRGCKTPHESQEKMS